MTRVEIAPGVFREQTNVIPLTSTEAVDKAWDAYAAHVARSREDPDLLLDREYVAKWAELETRFKRLFLMQDAET